MTGLCLGSGSSVISGCASRWPHRTTLVSNARQRRLVAGRLSHYSVLYEVQNEQSGLASDAAHHLHHMVHGASNALGPLYLATFCALSVTLGALLYNLTNVLNEYFALQQHLSNKEEDKPSLYGVDVSSSKMFKSQRVRAAAAFAAAAHAGQVRKTGEPYVTHCIETALIVESNLPHWRQDSRHETAVIAALLHDVLDDTPTTPEAISAAFGPTVTAMVVSVSKLSAVNQMLRRDKRKGVVSRDQSFWQTQWRRLKRMMFEAVVEEPLVILVKLADRLHNMRTVYALPPAKQQAVAEETLAVWCSMAASLGWHSLKSEMEDLCFAVLDTSTFCGLRQELDKLWSSPPPPRSRRRVKSSRRQLQLQQFAEQQQQLAAERAGKWGGSLLRRLQQGFDAQLQQGFGIRKLLGGGSNSSSSFSGSSVQTGAEADRNSCGSSAQPPGLSQTHQQQQQSPSGGLNLLLLGLWQPGPSAHESPSGLLPAPHSSLDDDVTPHSMTVTSYEEPKRASGADWGVTDAALSLRSLLGSSSATSSSNRSSNAAKTAAESTAATATAAAAIAAASVSSSSSMKGQLSPQQQQLRNILSTVVPFDAVSLSGASQGLTWSAQQGLKVLDEAATRLYTELAVGSFSGGLKVEIQGRLKSLRSVYTKMTRKQCSVEEVYDARALRVVVDDGGGARLADAVQCCYRLVSAVHKLWRPIHGEFDDYIANPKQSGYQALHTAVWGPGGAALEVQIKTAGMHEHAEYGGAAHWAYKEVLWGSAPAAAAAVDSVERNMAAAAAAAAATTFGAAEQQQQLQGREPLAQGAAAAAVAAAAAAARRSSNVQVLPTMLFTFDDEGQLVSSSRTSTAAVGGFSRYSSSSSSADVAVLARTAGAQLSGVQQQRTATLEPVNSAVPVAAAASAAARVQLAERPSHRPAAALLQQQVTGSRVQQQQQATAAAVTSFGATSTLERPAAPQQQRQQPPQSWVQLEKLTTTPQQQQQQPRPAPPLYVGQPVLRISDRLRYGVVLGVTKGSSGGGSSGSSGGGSPLLQLSPEGAAAQLSLAASTSSSSRQTGSSSSSSSCTLVCVIMSGGTNPDHPWRMPDYGFYAELLGYATAQGWLRPGQGDWHARLEEYEWCRDSRWHRRDHMGYLHPHTTLTLLEGYQQDAAEAAATQTLTCDTPTAASAPAANGGVDAPNSSSSSTGSSSTGSLVAAVRAAVMRGESEATGVTSVTPITRAVADAAMLRHSWATGGAGSSWRQQQQQQLAAAASASRDDFQSLSDKASHTGSSSGTTHQNLQQRIAPGAAESQPSHEASSSDSSSSDGDAASSSSSSSSSTDGSSGVGSQPVYAGTAAAGSDWAATAAKAAQLRSVIEWGLEAYGVNAAGSEPSSEVSVVIWPGGIIEDVPRGTTAGQILREKGVFAIMDPTATAPSSSSSDSDTDSSSSSTEGGGVESATPRKGDRSSRQRQQGQSGAQSGGGDGQQQQQQLVNVNNRLVSEDTVLRDGDLVILARERIKI